MFIDELQDKCIPAYTPAIGVLIPLALLTADLVKAPHVGSAWKQPPRILQIPSAIISCDASTTAPTAVLKYLGKNLLDMAN